MRKVWGFGDSILKGAVLSDGPAVKYTLLPEGFPEQSLRPMGFEVCNQARFGSTIVTGSKIFDRHLYSIAEGDIVTLEFGGNDCDFPWKDIGGNPDLPKLPVYADSIIYRYIPLNRPFLPAEGRHACNDEPSAAGAGAIL